MKKKSDENWSVGCRCLDEGNCNAAANRLYYGLFHAVLSYALKQKRGFVQKPNGMVHGDLARIVKLEGERGKYYGIFTRLQGLRNTADYYTDTPQSDRIRSLLEDGAQMRELYLRKAG